MSRFTFPVATIVLVSAVLGLAQSEPAGKPAERQSKVRIGVYDSRAIAVAYAPSRFNPVREKMAELDAAKAGGDKAKVKELETWGKEHQRMLHFQGFCRVPVSDLLEPVKDRLQQLAADQNLAAVVMSCDVVSADVEVVDVTDQIVELYDPSDRTRDMVRQVRDVEPVSLLSIGGHSDKK